MQGIRLWILGVCGLLVVTFAQTGLASSPRDFSPRCQTFESDQVQVCVRFEKWAGIDDEDGSILLLEATDSQTGIGRALRGEVRVELTMDMCGHPHGAPATNTQPVTGAAGVYRVTNALFYMFGVWEVHVVATDTNGTSQKKSFKVTLMP